MTSKVELTEKYLKINLLNVGHVNTDNPKVFHISLYWLLASLKKLGIEQLEISLGLFCDDNKIYYPK